MKGKSLLGWDVSVSFVCLDSTPENYDPLLTRLNMFISLAAATTYACLFLSVIHFMFSARAREYQVSFIDTANSGNKINDEYTRDLGNNNVVQLT